MFYLLFRATLPSILLSLSIMTLSLPPRSTLFPYTTLFRSYPLHVNGVVDFSNRCFSSNCRGDFSCCDVDYTCIDCLFIDRKSTRLNSSHVATSYAVFCLKQKNSPIPAEGQPLVTTPTPVTM